MQEAIQNIQKDFEKALNKASQVRDIEDLKVKYLGKKGPIQQLMQSLKDASKEERPILGKLINDLKVKVTDQCAAALTSFQGREEEEQIREETLDITLPGRRRFKGTVHPLTQMMQQIIEILVGMGFSIQYGPDIESDYYNFEAINFEADHPARDMQDTFYINAEMLLRTHTSNVQVRIMENNKPPIRVIAPGKVYRNENISARSHVFFHQLEGFYIDEGVTFADLIATLRELFSKLFNKKLKMRFRASYFPFVEPGMEVDIECMVCNQKGCNICKDTGWLEVAGAGMIHPELFKVSGIDNEKYTGYAWGLGIERLKMLQYGIKDIRLFTENDIRFLEQF